MHTVAPRRELLRHGLGLALALALPAARAHEYFTPYLTVIHPWTRASRPGATTAIVSMEFVEVTQTDRLIGAHTPVASGAELGGEGVGPDFDFVIPAGRDSALSEAGVFLRLLGLTQPLEQGREFPLTLVFARAGVTRAALLIDLPGSG